MSNTKTFKLKEAPREFQAGESTGFGFSFGVKYRDRQTGQDEWTNYKTVVFAKPGPQLDFYRNAFQAGTIITVSAEKEKIDIYEGQNGTRITIELLNSRVESIYTADSQQAPQQAPQQTPQQGLTPQQAQSWQQAPKQAPVPQQPVRQGAYNANQDFKDIPF